jgi:hypothetical protein
MVELFWRAFFRVSSEQKALKLLVKVQNCINTEINIGYHVFKIEDLLKFLAKDCRFEIIQEDLSAYCTLLKVKKV